MQSIQGFVIKNSRVSNVAGVVAENFELSPYAKTYSREIGWYQDDSYVGDTLSVFKAVNTDTGAPFVLPQAQVQEILGVTQAVVAYMATHNYPYSIQDLINTILAAFTGQIEQFQIGELKVGTTETIPEWLLWTSKTFPDTTIKVWLNNEAFENQYTDYEVVTVAPFDQLDDFFRPYGVVAGDLTALTIPMLMERVMAARGSAPETVIRIYEFPYHNVSNPSVSTTSYWGVVVYGKNGDNIDAIKDAIVKSILSQSTHLQEDWEVIFPDIFLRTEFLLYPRWDKVAIPNLTVLSALYSAVQDPTEVLSFAKAVWPVIPADWIEANLTIVPFDYKALAVIVLNGQKNLIGKKDWKALFPDYVPVSTSSLDFNRMSVVTREWLIAMEALLVIAETMTPFTSVPNPYRRVIRDDTLYVGALIDNVNYLVAARSNLA